MTTHTLHAPMPTPTRAKSTFTKGATGGTTADAATVEANRRKIEHIQVMCKYWFDNGWRFENGRFHKLRKNGTKSGHSMSYDDAGKQYDMAMSGEELPF